MSGTELGCSVLPHGTEAVYHVLPHGTELSAMLLPASACCPRAPPQRLLWCPILLRASYAMSGTDLGYADPPPWLLCYPRAM
eukprot:199727-Rhodomonas_salina.2